MSHKRGLYLHPINYWGLIISMFLICIAGPHGAFIPAFFMEILWLSTLSSGDCDINIILIFALIIILEISMIVLGRLNLSQSAIAFLFVLILVISNIIILCTEAMGFVNDNSMILFSSIPFFLFSALCIANVWKIKFLR